jgi:hypothetical protein
MYIQSTEGLALQGSGAAESNYGVRQISKSVQFTYANGLTDILTITASGSAPTNFTISFFYTWNAENFTNNSNGPQTNYAVTGYYLNSSGFFIQAGFTPMYSQGNAWQTQSIDVSTARTIKLRSQGNNATNTSLHCTYHISVSCSDFSLLTFS